MTCFVIGEGTLLIGCTTILCQQGFQVKGVISQDQQIRSYCDKEGFRYVDSSSDLKSVLEENPFDFLFSITNGYILPEAILRLPRQHTINYHDGPLPAYAGVHATFWALINGETTHGITWHLVDAGIDTGAIIKQRVFPIEVSETSISLNAKSYTAAIDSFREVVDDLLTDNLKTHPQNLTGRSYYARNKRPDLFINWAQSAADIDRLQRALDFGFHPNPFGCLKLWLNNTFFQVRKAVATTTKSQTPAGTVVSILPNNLLVSTKDNLLAIGEFQSLSGEAISIESLCEQTGLREGQLLAQPDSEIIEDCRDAGKECARHQQYWINKLVGFQPTGFPWPASHEINKDRKPGCTYIDISVPDFVKALLEEQNSPGTRADYLLVAALVMLARLTDRLAVHVGFQSTTTRRIATDTHGLFAEYVPFAVEFDWEAGLEEAVAVVRQEQVEVEKRLTFAQDLLISQPALHSVAHELSERGIPIIICCGQSADERIVPEKSIAIILTDEAKYQVAFNPSIWPAHWVSEFVNRWMLLLENMVFQPKQPLKTIPLLTQSERQRILVDWNNTAVAYPRDQPIHQLIEEQVRLRPQAEALRCERIVLTYQQLNQRANQVARYLQKQGVTSDTLVGLCLERSPEMIVSLLAILKAGGAYVPLDPNYPANRLNELVTQTGVQYIISQKIWVDRLPAEASCILFDEEQLLIDQEDDQNLNIAVGAEQLANVLFTSGSTGRSKGVAIPHRGVVRLVKNTNFMRLDETVSMLGLAPLAFDASTLEIWGSLVNGGRLVLIPESRPTLETIKQTIQSQAVNTAFFTAALFNVLVDSDISELTTLVQLVTGGEAASAEHVLRARRQLPACELINGYGPTESSTIASFYTMSEGNWQTSSVPIGTPISNTQLYIVDSFLNPVPVGIQGELLIGGDGLAREYLHQPELTHQKFIPDPFSGRPGSRLYRTGDQARFLADGTIEFLGRLDDQVKIRGHRIEPAEIEQALCQHPTVGAAVVVVDTSTPGNKRLVAYVVPKSEAVQVDDLRGFIKASLPDYLIPSVIIPIHAMPLTINGKVDKAKLPPAFGTGEQRNSWLNLTETTMASLWAAVLSHPPVNADDHFFELGGSSLTAIQLISQIYRQFGVQLRMNDIFEHATLRELSAYVDRNPLQAISPITYRVDQPGTTTSKPRFPLSFAQKRLWIIDQIDGSQGAYNVPIVLAIRGPLNQLALQKSLNEIIRRHSILHTTFGFANGAPFQLIEPPFSWPITVSEIPGSAETDIDERINQWIRAEGYRPFDLSEGPLLRASVVQRSETSWVLILVFHHIIYDGFSIRVLADELTAIYPSILANEPVTLPQLPIQYVDYALWQVDQHRPDTLNRELTYWKTRLAGVAPLLNLPIDKPRPPVQSFAGADYSFAIPDRLWQRLRYDLREPGTTPFLRLLTVFAVWLQQVAKTSDVVIGIPVAGRTRPELNSLIGFFVNTLPLRVEVSPERTYRQQLRNVRELTLEAFDHQTLPFEQIVEELRPVRSRAYSPLVQVVFDFQEDTSNYWRLNGLEVKPVPFEQHMAKFDLHLSVRETSAGVEGTLNYRTELFEERTIAQMAHDFIQLLEQLLTQPDKPLIELQAGALPTDKALRTTASDPDFVTYNTEIEPVLPDLDYTLVETLHPIWTKLLHTDSIGLDEDFFDSGGHSLLAVQLVNEIQRQTGYSMPVASVFANPTLRKLATYLKTTEVQAVWHPLVAVKPQGDRHPLFLVHPISGDVGYVYQLAPYVAEQQPVYALRAVGLDGIAKPSVSIEEMAAHYVELITHQQAEGPYSLGGFSLGGIVAFEMARQLTQLGKKVNLVAIIDAYPINPDADTNRIPIRQLVPYYYNYWRSLPKQPSMLLPILRKKVPWASQLLLRQFRRSFYKPSVSAVNTTSQASSFVPKDLLVKTFRQAYSQYAFKPYDGKIVFLRAAKADTFGASQNKVDFGWSRYARQGVDVHEIPGEHESLFSNNATIERIAHILQSYLMP